MRLLSLFLTASSAALVAAQGGYGGGYGGYGGPAVPSSSSDSGGGNGNSSPGGPPSGSGGNGGGNNDNGGGNNDDGAAASSTASAASSSASSAAASTSSEATAGKTCTSLMCINAIINGSTTTYELSQATSTQPGWMAIGFGQTMADSPMVILWANTDGTITVSQREANAEVMPSLVSNPPRLANVSMANSDLTSANSKTYAFTIPTDSSAGTSLKLIWAFSDTNPGSTDAGATLVQHLNSGPLVLDASTPFNALAGSGGGVTATPAAAVPLLPYQKYVIVHAILFVVAFAALLPTGALFARLLRTTSMNWFRAHWLIQFYITAPIIIVAFIFSIVAVQDQGSGHFNDTHKKLGLALVILYGVQCSYGALVHFIKDANRKRRPPQNYGHAILGITIIVLAFYQIRLGYKVEWPLWVGRPMSSAVNVVWIVWAVVIGLLYVGGLALLPKQYRQEAAARNPPPSMQARQAYRA